MPPVFPDDRWGGAPRPLDPASGRQAHELGVRVPFLLSPPPIPPGAQLPERPSRTSERRHVGAGPLALPGPGRLDRGNSARCPIVRPGGIGFFPPGRLPACQRLRTSGGGHLLRRHLHPSGRLPSPAAPLPPAPSLGPAASGRQHLPAHCQPAHVRGLRPPIFHPLPGALHTPSAPTPGPYRACGHPVLWQSGVGTLAAAGCHRAGSAHSGASRVPRGGGLLPRGKPPYFVPFHQGKRPPVLRQHPRQPRDRANCRQLSCHPHRVLCSQRRPAGIPVPLHQAGGFSGLRALYLGLRPCQRGLHPLSPGGRRRMCGHLRSFSTPNAAGGPDPEVPPGQLPEQRPTSGGPESQPPIIRRASHRRSDRSRRSRTDGAACGPWRGLRDRA